MGTSEVGGSGTSIVPAPPVAPERTEDTIVIARTPAEMEVAQRGLVTWAEARILRLQAELQEAESNHAHAKANHWRLAPWKKAVERALARVVYYSKIKAALEAGYVIMPDLPGETFAVRTKRTDPVRREISSTWRTMQLPSAVADSSPVGVGRYVSPQIDYRTWDRQEGEGNQKTTRHFARAMDYTDVDFPMVMVKPQILDETNRAMLMGIFDEVAILPAGSGESRPRLAATQQPDPIIIGRVVREEGSKRIACAFLITWWLDTRTI